MLLRTIFANNCYVPNFAIVHAQVIKTGYLEKKGHVRHTWKKRWFILTSTDLTYYETKDSELFIKKVL